MAPPTSVCRGRWTRWMRAHSPGLALDGDLLRAAMAVLPAEQCHAIGLAFFAGRSPAEIAAATNGRISAAPLNPYRIGATGTGILSRRRVPSSLTELTCEQVHSCGSF